MLPHLLILAAGIVLGFILGGNFGILLCTAILRARRLRLRALHGPRSSVHGHYPPPDISRTWAFRLIGISNCTFPEAQRIAAALRLQ